MKKKKIAFITGIVVAVVFLGGIATYVYVFKNNHSASEIKDGVTDTQSSWNTDTHHIAAGNGGYYYTQYDADGKIRLYYTQVENENGVVLCALPECTHKTDACRAVLSGEAYQFGTVYYYKDFLYVIHKKEGMGYLCKIDSDGSGREDVCALFAMDKFSSVSLVFHENDIYAYDSVGNAGGSENHVQEIKKISIGDYAVSTVYEYSGVGAAITGARDFGGYLYFIVMEYRLDMDSKTHYADERLYRYDYGNGIAEKVIDKQVSDYFVLGDTLVYFESGTGLYVYDFKTQKETLEVQADKNILVAGISYDGQYFYLDNAGMGSLTDAASRIERVIYVYDRSFNLIREIDCGKDCTGVYFGDEKYLFIKQLDAICYIKKEDILNGEWVQLK